MRGIGKRQLMPAEFFTAAVIPVRDTSAIAEARAPCLSANTLIDKNPRLLSRVRAQVHSAPSTFAR